MNGTQNPAQIQNRNQLYRLNRYSQKLSTRGTGYLIRNKGNQILHLEGDGSTELLNTMIFNAFVFCQVFNEVNAREMEKLNVFRHTFNNWVFIIIITFTVVFQVLMVQVLGKFAGTVPLNQEQWLITVGIGFVSLFVAVIVKFIPTPETPVFWRREPNYIDVNGYQVIPSEPPLNA